MKITTNSKQLFFAVIWLFITIAEITCSVIEDSTASNLDNVSWIVIFNFIFQTLTLLFCKRQLVSFFYAFISFYYIFHFGQIIMTGLFPNYELDYMNYVEYYMTTPKILCDTIKLCIVSINAFFIGGLLVDDRVSIHLGNKGNSNEQSIVGKLFYIFFSFRLFVDVIQIVAAMKFGYYGAIRATEMIPGVISTLGNMWYAIVPVYYLVLEKSDKRKFYLFFIMSYLLVTMLTGNRGHQIVCIASILVVILLIKKNISIVTILKFILIAVVGMFVIDIIYAMRETSISDFLSNPLLFMKSSSKSNIVLETIGTFGETIYTPYLTIGGDGTNYNTWFGEPYVKSFVGVIPDFFGWFRNINNEAIFAKKLGTESAIGGSFSGELYYSFGSFYPLVSLLIGMIYYSISNKVSYFIRNHIYGEAIMNIVICSLALWWVRDSIGNLTRQIVWMYWLLIFFRRKIK